MAVLLEQVLFIDKRPPVVNEKSRVGDWEIDTIIGKNRKQAIITLVERFSKKTVCKKILSRKAGVTREAIVSVLNPLADKVLTITGDNGLEFAAHEQVKQTLEAQTYFCDPYKSYQKGAVEQVNLWLRERFPRTASQADVTPMKQLQRG